MIYKLKGANELNNIMALSSLLPLFTHADNDPTLKLD